MADALRWMPLALSLRSLRQMMLALLTTLVLLQTIGMVHRVVHPNPNLVTPAQAVEQKVDVLAAIWCDHQNPGLCQLIDHASADVLVTSTMASVALPALHIWYALSLHERFALFERFYAARGPPAVLH